MKDQSSQVFLQRARVINFIRKTVFICFVIALFYSLAAVVYSTRVIYKVKLNYAVILEQFGGSRIFLLKFFSRAIMMVSPKTPSRPRRSTN